MSRWTDQEIAELTRRYPHARIDSIARDLGRGRAGVADKANRLGLRKPEMRPWTQAERDVIRKRYPDEPAHAIARDLDRHESTIYYQAKQLGIEKSPDFLRTMAQRPRAPRRDAWTRRELEDLRRLYPYERTGEVAKLIGRSPEATNSMAFKQGIKKTDEYMVEQNKRLCEGGRKHRIKPGATPPNKGLRRPGWHSGRMKETQFKKGHVSANLQQIGELRYAKKDGTWWIKISMTAMPVQRRWLEVHKLVWMRQHGDIPPKHVIRFIDGKKPDDAADITAHLLECITLAENCRRNSIHNLPQEMVDAIMQKGRLTREINKQERAANEEQH